MGDPYQQFLAEQREREVEWTRNREASKAKKVRMCSQETESSVSSAAGRDAQVEDELRSIAQQLEEKTRECSLLRNQLLGQESLCKVSTKIGNLIRIIKM